MTEYAYHLLRLEQRLESHQRLHQEELDEIRRAIVELRNQILFNNPVLDAGLNGAQKHSLQVVDECSPVVMDGNQDAGIDQKLQQDQEPQ